METFIIHQLGGTNKYVYITNKYVYIRIREGEEICKIIIEHSQME